MAAEHPVGADDELGGAGGGAAGVGDGRPLDAEHVAVEGAGAGLDRTGDDPLDGVLATAGVGDGDGARVLDVGRVDAVDDVGADDALAVVEAVAGEAAHRETAGAERDQDHHGDGETADEPLEGARRGVSGFGGDRHGVDSTDEWRLPRWAKVLTSVAVLVAIGAMAFAIFQPVKVLPRLRLAPGYAMVDQAGERVTSEDGRGAVTLVTFVPLDCGAECDRVNDTMREVRERVERDVDLAGMSFRLLTIVLDPDPAADDVVAARTAADADWTWVTGTESQLENVVGLGFRRSTDVDDFTPGYAVIDGFGMIRGEYRYRTLADDTDKLVRHVDILGSELRNDSGFASFVYDAAHAFQCYP